MAETENNPKDGSPPGTFDLKRTLTILDPAALEVEQNVGDGLILRGPPFGERRGVRVAPCFPVTQPGRFLVFTGEDGEEIGILENMADLSPAFRGTLAEELAKQHFIPTITAVDAVYREFQIPIWEVRTDRGPRRLELKSRHDCHRLPGGRVYIRDAEGNGYLIPDVGELDSVSRRLIELNV